MKPNFALTLSFKGIGLLNRAFPGWHMVGEVSLDHSDLPGALSELRSRAETLDANPIRSKLVIPNDQIRYLQFDSEGLEADEIASAVPRALEGATPYAVDDLVYDWSIGAGQVHVAAVARETLVEAEAFASEHGFNPLCFVAAPEGRDFVGEPWFGETQAASSLLPDGGRVDRDTAAIRVIGMAPAPAASASDAAPGLGVPPTTPPGPEPEIPPQPDPEPEIPPQPEPDLPPQPDPQPEPDIPPAPGTPPRPDPEIEPDPGTPPTPRPDIPPEPTPTPDPDIPPQPGRAEDAPDSSEEMPLPHPEVSLTGEDASRQDAVASPQDPGRVTPPATVADGASDADWDDTSGEVPGDGETPDDGSKSDTRSAAVAFSSIRARRDDMPAAPRRLSGASRQAPAKGAGPADAPQGPRATPALTATPPAEAGPDAAEAATTGKVTGTPQDALTDEAAARIGATLRPTDADRMSQHGEEDAAAPTGDESAWGDEDAAGDIPPPPSFMADRAAPPPQDAPAAALAAQAPVPGNAPSFTSRRKGLKPEKRRLGLRQAASASPEATHEQEKQRMTIFGARKPASVGGKPRFLGLILTAVLLLFLVGVAAWASIFLEDGIARVLRDGPEPETEQVATTPDAEIDPSQAAVPAESTAPDDAPGEATVTAALPGVTSDVDDAPRTARPEPDPAELTEQQARSRYAVTGIWQRAPEPPTEAEMQSLEDFYLTSIDPQVLQQDAVALPDVGTLRDDTRPDTPPAPPAADTMFTMDPRGLVQPTPEGALTPDGVRVYAGQPAPVPPDRPAETLAQPGEDPQEAAERIAALERMAALRPRVRPGDLSESNERETLGGRTRDELAGLRPRLRPQSAQELAEQAAAASTADTDVSPDPDAVTAALEAAAAVPAPDPFAGATAQAVKVSVKPNARPGNFDRIVRRSQRQAEQQAARSASAAVPRNQRIAPSGPTPTTVARAATEKNALRMRRVNLIGVYGTTSNRRALVRLANGNYKKVKVGDRLDGGRVAAIGTSELRYVKSGRSVTLTMPRG